MPSLFSKKPHQARHLATKEPWWQKFAIEPADPTPTVPTLTAEEHVVQIRKLAGREQLACPVGEEFYVSYFAPEELHLEMAMQFIAHADVGAVADGRDPFIYVRREGNRYIFRAV